jgi:DNA-binding GntR family transcriptional regulator
MTHEPAGIYRPRLSHDGNFTIIPNSWIRNSGLSAHANYLLIYLISHEIGYEIKFEQISRETGLGVKAIRSAIRELQAAGWLTTERTKKPNGQLGAYRYRVIEPNATTLPQATVAEATMAQATMAQGTHNKKINNKENKLLENKEQELAREASERQLFEEFYKEYPRKMKPGDARKAFSSALNRATFEDLLAGAIRLRNDPNLPEERFIPYPATWLRGDSWLDGPLPPDPKKQKEQERLKAELEIQEYLRRESEAGR